MPSTFTTLGIEKIATGEQDGVWGERTNVNWDLVETPYSGRKVITIASTEYTLSVIDGADDDARYGFIEITGSPGADADIIVPARAQLRHITNSTGFNLTIKTTAGAARTCVVKNGAMTQVICDGANCDLIDMYDQEALDARYLQLSGGTLTDNVLVPDVEAPPVNKAAVNYDTVQAMISDAVNAVIEQGRIAVNGLYITTSTNNPSADLGYGTWVAYANGRALVGVGTAQGESWVVNEAKGTADIALTAAQMPAHSHTMPNHTHTFSDTSTSAGAHNHRTIKQTNSNGTGNHTASQNSFDTQNTAYSLRFTNTTPDSGLTTTDGAHTHFISGTTSGPSNLNTNINGSGQTHTNIQPSVGVYIWRRVS